jgi:hypothetical protein
MRNWQVLLLPDLQRLPPEEHAAAIRNAGETELDIVELAGLAVALLLVTWATRYSLADVAAGAGLPLATLLNFAIALPLLAAAFAPFHIRRLRRGLREQLARRPGTR